MTRLSTSTRQARADPRGPQRPGEERRRHRATRASARRCRRSSAALDARRRA
ncbi:MAG: hypothetical protein MZW92_03910 [Comamonadaceae bacterium]|nr:hypothetical protein [Comamonadaceae bacterium]